jgi:DNA polymerase III epsilon subunit family exonuclease
MQLQLSLKIADRLHHDLLVRGAPLAAGEAARLLLSASATQALSLEVLRVLVRDDQRFCWCGAAGDLLTLRSWESADPDLATVPFVALDLETTGAKAGAAKITEIGAVRIEGLCVAKHFHTLVNPQRVIPPMITSITGITQSMVADAPRIEEVIPSLLEFLEGAVVVAHNAPFDVGFLNYELHRLRSRRLGEGAIDTLPLSRALVPGLANYRLRTVAEALGAPVLAYHRALADAQAVAHVFVHLAGLLQERGVTGLRGVREHGRLSPPSHLEKLSLTRGLPEGPGTFIFMGEEERVLLVGRADRIAEEVRSFFVTGGRQHRGLRTAVRLVDRVDCEQTVTPLEAVVREQELLLEHRPPYNPYWTAPEGYVYIRAGGRGPGLSLYVTRRAPRWLRDADSGPAPVHGDLVIGPFRRRSSAQAAVALLRRCYPIRHCPRRAGAKPCERGALGQCLSPCTADAETRATHDSLVTDLVMFLAGQRAAEALDPAPRAETTARTLVDETPPQQERLVEQNREHLAIVQRAYCALAKASELRLAYLWRQSLAGQKASVRLNLVWNGRLVACASLHADELESRVAETLESLRGHAEGCSTAGGGALVAVPQNDLDALLAVGRWLQDGARAGGVAITLRDSRPESLQEATAQIVRESLALLGR